MKCKPKANNNREAVVVCARHVVKRPSKRLRASIYVAGEIESHFGLREIESQFGLFETE